MTEMVDPDSWERRRESLTAVEWIESLSAGPGRPSHSERLGTMFARVEPGKVEMLWTPTEAVSNPAGNVHGGYIAMALDDVCCMAAASTGERFIPMLTLSLNIDYFRAVKPGRSYTLHASVAHPSKRRMVVNGVIRGADGTVVAQATAAVTPNLAFAPGASDGAA